MAKVKIVSNGSIGHIYVDGKEVPDVRRYHIEHSAGKLPTFVLDIVASEVTFDGDGFVPALPEVFRPFYKAETVNADQSEIAALVAVLQERQNPTIDAKELSLALQRVSRKDCTQVP